jgi:hypothetical protein
MPVTDSFIQKAALLRKLTDPTSSEYNDIVCIQETNKKVNNKQLITSLTYTKHVLIEAGDGPGKE